MADAAQLLVLAHACESSMTTSRAIAKLAHKKCVEEARRGDVVLMDALREIATAAEHCEAVWTNVHNKLVLIAKEQGVSGWGER